MADAEAVVIAEGYSLPLVSAVPAVTGGAVGGVMAALPLATPAAGGYVHPLAIVITTAADHVWLVTDLGSEHFGVEVVVSKVIGATLTVKKGFRVALADIGDEVVRVTEVSFGGATAFLDAIGNGSGAQANFKRYPGGPITPRTGGTDARILPIRTGPTGIRHREWREVADNITEEVFEDWPIKGPRTSLWCAQFMRRRNSCADHHLMWRTTAKLQPEQWGVAEHETLLNIVEVAGGYDQLDLGNCAFAEAIFRRLQVIEWAYADKLRDAGGTGGGSKLEYEEIAAFSGRSGHSENSLMVAPSLLEHVKLTVEKDAVILKNLRKAREERAERAKGGKK
jgi:hypothetical protein